MEFRKRLRKAAETSTAPTKDVYTATLSAFDAETVAENTYLNARRTMLIARDKT